MDTVTESAMGIAIAKLGGIGFIHRFLTIEKQVREVQKVKRHKSYLIENPISIPPKSTLQEAKDLLSFHGISGLLVAGTDAKLQGILTNRDMRWETEFLSYQWMVSVYSPP